MLLKPVKVPPWLEQALSVLPYIYLGAGVLFAATGSAFIICQYDPFVPIFRMNGRTLMVLSGAALLLLGVFVGRPYCRFLCPYGALAQAGRHRREMARARDALTTARNAGCAKRRARSARCASRNPAQPARKPWSKTAGAWRGCWRSCRCSWPAAAGWDINSARRHRGSIRRSAWPTSWCAAEGTAPKFGALSPDDLALERARQTPKEILTEAAGIRHKFDIGGWIFGAWVGLVIGAKLISLSVRRKRTDYEPDRGDCFACARCFEYCPNELVRRGLMPAAAPALGAGANPSPRAFVKEWTCVSRTPNQDRRSAAPERRRWRLAGPGGWRPGSAGVFAVLIGLTLFVGHARAKAEDPLKSPQLREYKEKLQAQPGR